MINIFENIDYIDGIRKYKKHFQSRNILAITDPPYNVLNEDWDKFELNEFYRFTMRWLSELNYYTDRIITFAPSTNDVIKELAGKLFKNIRRLIWYKGASSTGDDKLWFSFEEAYWCNNIERQQTAEPKSLIIANIIKEAREKIKLSRGGVDMVIRGKKTGLCYRWEEGACLPTQEQANRLKELLKLNHNFQIQLDAAYEIKQEVQKKTSMAFSENGAIQNDVFPIPAPPPPC